MNLGRPIIQKTPALRNRKFLDLAHSIQECQLQVPGVCKGFSPEGCEPCHGNWSWTGISTAKKSDDVFAAGCHDCHRALDEYQNGMTRAEAEQLWSRGVVRTLIYMMRHEMLAVA